MSMRSYLFMAFIAESITWRRGLSMWFLGLFVFARSQRRVYFLIGAFLLTWSNGTRPFRSGRGHLDAWLGLERWNGCIQGVFVFFKNEYTEFWMPQYLGHIHGILWLKNGPKVEDKNLESQRDRQELVDFYMQLVYGNAPIAGHPRPAVNPCQVSCLPNLQWTMCLSRYPDLQKERTTVQTWLSL